MQKPSQWQRDTTHNHGVMFVDIGKTPLKDYMQPVPEMPTRTGTGKVIGELSQNAIRVQFGKEEVAVIIPVGWETPKAGETVPIEMRDGTATLQRKDLRK